MSTMMWTQADAIALCRELEAICPAFGCHVALTGGLLYKDGERKDCDIVLYRIREVDEIDVAKLFRALSAIGITIDPNCEADEYGDEMWCVKTWCRGRPLDIFFPEVGGGASEPDWARLAYDTKQGLA